MGDPPSPRTPLENALATDAKLRGAIFRLVNGFGANSTRAAKRHTDAPLETARPANGPGALPDAHQTLGDHHRLRRLGHALSERLQAMPNRRR